MSDVLDKKAVETVLADMYVNRPSDSDRSIIMEIERKISELPYVAPTILYRDIDQTGIEKALESIAIDMHKQVRLMQELIMTLEKMRKGQK